MTDLIPRELSVGGIYVPPALVVLLMGFVVAVLAASIFNRTRLSRFFWHPPLVFVAIWVLACALVGMYLVSTLGNELMRTAKRALRLLLSALVVVAAGIAAKALYEKYTEHPWTRDGQVQADVILVTPEVAGTVAKVGVVDGQFVTRGTLLFEIDPRPFAIAVKSCRIQLAEARQQVAALEADVAVAEANVEAALTGIESAKGKIEASRAEIDAAKGVLAASEAGVKVAQAQVAQCNAELKNARTQRDRAHRLVKDGAGSVANAESRTANAEAAVAALDAARADERSAQAGCDQSRAGLSESEANLIVSLTGLGDAEAQHASALANLRKAQANLGVSGEDNVEIQAAKASLEKAELDLSWTRLAAPVDGYVTNLVVKVGDYATVGKPMLAVVDSASFYVQGFFRETQLAEIQIGDRAVVTLMGYDDQPLEGRVEAVGRAINPPNIAQTGSSGDSSIVPVVQPSFDWIRLAQRVPVRIKLTSVPDGVMLISGTTTSVSIRPKDSGDR